MTLSFSIFTPGSIGKDSSHTLGRQLVAQDERSDSQLGPQPRASAALLAVMNMVQGCRLPTEDAKGTSFLFAPQRNPREVAPSGVP